MAKKKSETKKETNGSHVIDIEEAQESRRKKRQQDAANKRRQKRKEEREKQDAIRQANTPEKRKKKRKKQITTKRILLIIIILAILAFLGITIFQIAKLKIELNEAITEKEQRQAEKVKLEKELELINDPEYIEEQARERLRMARQGEIVFIFPEEDETHDE